MVDHSECSNHVVIFQVCNIIIGFKFHILRGHDTPERFTKEVTVAAIQHSRAVSAPELTCIKVAIEFIIHKSFAKSRHNNDIIVLRCQDAIVILNSKYKEQEVYNFT